MIGTAISNLKTCIQNYEEAIIEEGKEGKKLLIPFDGKKVRQGYLNRQ